MEKRHKDKSIEGGKTLELKYLEWNLHGKGGKGYKMPEFVANYALAKDVDIMVFVEFCMCPNWGIFKSSLEKKHYDLYISPYAPGCNQVCIALRRELFQVSEIAVENPIDNHKPEFLQVDTSIEGKKLTIVGTRIKTQCDTKRSQYAFLRNHLSRLSTVFCAGDFNCVYSTLKEELKTLDIYGPRVMEGYYSFVHRTGDFRELDWVVSKGIKRIWNPYSDKNRSPFATCDWGFITEANGYGDKTKFDFLGIHSLPDHAILMGAAEI